MSGGNYINLMKSLYIQYSIICLEFETLLKKVQKEKRRKEKQGLPADRAVPSVDWAEAPPGVNDRRETLTLTLTVSLSLSPSL